MQIVEKCIYKITGCAILNSLKQITTRGKEMNKTEQKVMEIVKKSGFTFKGDSIFASYTQASRAINGLVKKGMLVVVSDKDGRTSYSAA